MTCCVHGSILWVFCVVLDRSGFLDESGGGQKQQ
jgi:hypothetical protein